ncbi:MAG TPA: hypothetical protein VF498_12600 [Anaerolineales bacterium]
MSETDPTLSTEQSESLLQLAESANEKLETAGHEAANRALNLGCSLGMLPALLFALLAFILTRGNWVITAVIAVLAVVAVLLFANLAAYTAKIRTSQRTYQRDVQPEIERTLKILELTRASFDRLAGQSLPDEAVLRGYLNPSSTSTGDSPEEISEDQ